MSTAMSSKRSYISARHEARGGSYQLLALIGGFLVMILGVVIDVPLVMGAGFVAFVSSALYYNAMFWAKKYDKGQLKPTRVSAFTRYM